jgi:FMN phosphatase YigB (HAD superfamily)
VKQQVILFDLGGVLFDLDYSKTADAFRQLGFKAFDSIYSQAKQDGVFDAFETGQLSAQNFRDKLRYWLPGNIRDEQIDSAWNAMLLGIKPQKLVLLKKLQERFPLFLLSNTNEIHLKEVFRMNEEMHGFKDLSAFMRKQYYSCQLKMRKPDRNIFDFVLSDLSLKPKDVFFIDDSIQHIIGARSAGITAHHLLVTENLVDLFP